MELKIKMPTKDEAEEMYKNFYKETSEDVCNISYWFPKIESCGIKVPRTFIKKVPIEIARLFTLEQPDTIDKIIAWTKEEIEPLIKNLGGLPFIKNGCFSNKFDFKSAIPHSNYLDVAKSIMDIMYQSISYDTGGWTEVAIRERIPYNLNKTATIYNGMPLRNEYRVFYDFDKKKLLYSVNYWDWDYCYKGIEYVATDKIIYEAVYPKLQEHFLKMQETVEQLVSKHIKSVEGLSGQWSIDILEDEAGEFWLIDMAIAQRSAYWDESKIS